MFATSFFRASYAYILKPILFCFDPEDVHDLATQTGILLGRFPITQAITRHLFDFRHHSLEQNVLGIHFSNPVGLAAGFDKNAELIDIMGPVGFGFSEVGSITGESCTGNPKPRLWRLPKSEGIMVWYGLKNKGSKEISNRLQRKSFSIPIGTSVARTNDATTVEIEAGIADYIKAFSAMATIGAYTTVNISCPNTCGGEPFTTPERLERLLTELDKIPTEKPIFLKFPSDIPFTNADALIDVAKKHRVNGFVIANLTKEYSASTIDQSEISNEMKGGIGGKPTFSLSNALISHAYSSAGDRFTIIGVGGIFTAEDAYAKIRAGASLVQLATGMIFRGPQLIGEINKGLVELLARDGFTNIAQAVGADHRKA
ncbi:MAG: quinone-dependent dihydroorotate dehydrogenase [Patescibacteria group bacterium]|jgi:dihydroorotate dehydrogenase subfamily 2